MFNALNRFISRLDADSPQTHNNHGTFGFQVLRNKTPELGIEPWFDFIIGINGRLIVRVSYPFLKISIDLVLNRTIQTQLYSLKKSAIVLVVQ